MRDSLVRIRIDRVNFRNIFVDIIIFHKKYTRIEKRLRIIRIFFVLCFSFEVR